MFHFPALCFFQFKSAQGHHLALILASFHKCSTVALTNMAKVTVTWRGSSVSNVKWGDLGL